MYRKDKANVCANSKLNLHVKRAVIINVKPRDCSILAFRNVEVDGLAMRTKI